MPVVRAAEDGEREIVTMSWGFMLLQNGKAPRPVTWLRGSPEEAMTLAREYPPEQMRIVQ
jgi:putative SOS response-associated peptidase YedK